MLMAQQAGNMTGYHLAKPLASVDHAQMSHQTWI